MVASPQPGSTNPRTLIVEFTRSIVDRAIGRPDRVRIAEIQEQVERRFLDDQSFVMSLAIMNVREICIAAIREAIAETRGSPNARVIVRDFITTPADLVAQTPALMQALALRWGRFLEWDGVHHVRLTSMNRPELRRAAKIRRDRAMHELAYADFLDALADKLPDDTTSVGVAIPLEIVEKEFVTAQDRYGRLKPTPGGGPPPTSGSAPDPTTGADPQGTPDVDIPTEGGETAEQTDDTNDSEPSDEPQQP